MYALAKTVPQRQFVPNQSICNVIANIKMKANYLKLKEATIQVIVKKEITWFCF